MGEILQLFWYCKFFFIETIVPFLICLYTMLSTLLKIIWHCLHWLMGVMVREPEPHTRGFGSFYCGNCTHSWKSDCSWEDAGQLCRYCGKDVTAFKRRILKSRNISNAIQNHPQLLCIMCIFLRAKGKGPCYREQKIILHDNDNKYYIIAFCMTIGCVYIITSFEKS